MAAALGCIEDSLRRKQFPYPSVLRPDGLPVERESPQLAATDGASQLRREFRDGPAPSRRPPHRPHGRSPNDRWLSPDRPRHHGPSAQARPVAAFRYPPVQMDGYGRSRTTPDRPEKRAAYPPALLS